MTSNGTVAVTSANGRVGQELLRRLRTQGFEVVALVRRPADVPAGTTMITDWTRSAAARRALAEADAVVHLSGEVSARTTAEYDAANVATTRVVADAARPGQRLVFLSYPGADPAADNAFLRAKGQAERLLLGCPAEAVILQTHIIAHPSHTPGPFEESLRRPGRRGRVRIIGSGRDRVRPVAQSDVVDAIVAVLRGSGTPGVHQLVGPDALTLDDLVRLYNNDPDARITHLPGWLARSLSRVVPGLSPTFVDLFLRPIEPGHPEPLASALGLRLTPLTTLWARPEEAGVR